MEEAEEGKAGRAARGCGGQSPRIKAGESGVYVKACLYKTGLQDWPQRKALKILQAPRNRRFFGGRVT